MNEKHILDTFEVLPDGGWRRVSSEETLANLERIRALLRPDHACTGSSSISRTTSEWHPCPGCVRQRERVFCEHPELFAQKADQPPSVYDRVERWMREFYEKAATNFNGTPAYYENAASGLAIALQEIDRERYDRTSSEIWNEYQAKKAAHND